MLIPKNTEEAREIGEKLSRKEILAYWEEYKCSLSDQRLVEEMLKKGFREQMLRETVEGYLGASGHHSLTKDHIEILLKKEGTCRHLRGRENEHEGKIDGLSKRL